MKKFAIALAAVVLSTGMAFGQANSGNLVGVVKDASGALLPNATVTVVNEATGVKSMVKTNAAGEYRIDNLLPGSYDITVTAGGFQSRLLKGLEIQLNQTATSDAQLAIASSSNTVEVESTAGAALDTTSNNLTTTFGAQELAQLPTTDTGGFGALNAALLAPNVASGGGVGVGAGPSVAGQRTRNNNFTIEGIDVNSKSVTGPSIIIPNDATGEFTLITGQFSPEFGHSSGGQFNTNVLSGTNHFHGRLFEYFNNRLLNAVNVPAGVAKPARARYDSNRYGGQVGGPVFRDKLFFFSNFQRSEVGQSEQYYLCVPTTAGLATLKALGSTAGYNLSQTNLTAYLAQTPAANAFGGAQVTTANDAACFNQASGGQTLDVYPNGTFSANQPYGTETSVPGIYGSGTPTAIPLGNYLVGAPVFSNTDTSTSSLDYTPTQKDSFRLRFQYLTQGSQDTAAYLPQFFQATPFKAYFLSFGYFHNFTPNLTNEVRLGYNRNASITPAGGPAFVGLSSFPNLVFYDQGAIQYGPDPNAPQSNVQNLYQFVDNVTYTKGRHTMTFGFDGRKYIAPQTFTQRVRGDYEYGYLTEFLNDVAPTEFGQRSSGNFIYYGDQTALYGYGNDTWRVSDKLTLNYGLRYEFTSVPVGQRAQALNIGASCTTANPCTGGGGLGIQFTAPQPQKTNFMPRLGIDYQVGENTSVRAGFGMAYDVIFDNIGLLSFPPQYSSTTNVNTSATPGNAPCVITSAGVNAGCSGFIAGGGLPAGTGTLNTYPTVTAQRAATSAYLPNQVLPYSEVWNLTVEHVFFKNYTGSIQYIGSRGIHLLLQDQLNVQAKVNATNQLTTLFSTNGLTPVLSSTGTTLGYTESTPTNANVLSSITAVSNILPQYLAAGFTGKITSYQPFGGSNYNGLGANLTRRFTNGLQFNASYTYSRLEDNSTTEVNADALSQRRPQDSRNVAADYSRSALDRPNRFTFEAYYDVPYFKHSNFLLRNALSNWAIAPIWTIESPEFVTVSSGVNSNLNGDSSAISRTIVNPNVKLTRNVPGNQSLGTAVLKVYSSTIGTCSTANTAGCTSANQVGYVAANPNAYYVEAGSGTLPNQERNTLPGYRIDNVDMTATKRIAITERYNFQFTAIAYNLFNHAQYVPGSVDGIGGTSTAAANPGYFNVQSALFNLANKEWGNSARSLNLQAKFNF